MCTISIYPLPLLFSKSTIMRFSLQDFSFHSLSVCCCLLKINRILQGISWKFSLKPNVNITYLLLAKCWSHRISVTLPKILENLHKTSWTALHHKQDGGSSHADVHSSGITLTQVTQQVLQTCLWNTNAPLIQSLYLSGQSINKGGHPDLWLTDTFLAWLWSKTGLWNGNVYPSVPLSTIWFSCCISVH